MVTISYFRLILLNILFFLINTLLYCMDEFNIELKLQEALNLYKSNNIIILDIRTANEWKTTGIIPNSILISMHDENFLERKDFVKELKKVLSGNDDKSFALICASGSRSKVVTDFLLKEGYKNISHIPDGILGKQNDGWLFKGYPLLDYNNQKEKN